MGGGGVERASGASRRARKPPHRGGVALPAIGAAADHGDLSENAEFTAALEQRDRLTERIGVIEQELGRAGVIDPASVPTDHVGVGSGVRARNLATGETETFRFLGPWTADPDEGLYFYRAPLSLAFMGKQPGEQVTFGAGPDARRWEVLEIFSALE